MPLEKSKIKKILVVSLTNIGDVILTFPVIDILLRDFSESKISIVIGPKAGSLLEENKNFENVYVFDKQQDVLKTIALVWALRKERFDFVVDLRNTAIPALIAPRYRTSFRVQKPQGMHMRDKHLLTLKAVYPFEKESEARLLTVSQENKHFVAQVLKDEIGIQKRFVVMAPGAANRFKRWPENEFAKLADHFVSQNHLQVVFVGDKEDRKIAQGIMKVMECTGINLCGRLNLIQLAELLKHCLLVVANDSAPMHLASYLNVPTVALFGPSDPSKYGPWGKNCCYLKGDPKIQESGENSVAKDGDIASISYRNVLDAVQISNQCLILRK